jgi:hypothetical protein
MQIPIFEKLDRILVSTEWEVKYPQAMVRALPRGILDHTPLLLDTGTPSHPKAFRFKVELAWLFKDGLHEKVKEVWQRETKRSTSIEIWHNKIRTLRWYLRGWSKNINGIYKKEKRRS